jgi:hypothetical protein
MSRSGRMGRRRVIDSLYGRVPVKAQQSQGTIEPSGSLSGARRPHMANDREKISTGPNDRPLNETIAGTGPGIPDEALVPGKDLPEPPDEQEEKRIRERLGVQEEVDTLPLEGE